MERVPRSTSDPRRNGAVFEDAAKLKVRTDTNNPVAFSDFAEDFPDDKVPFLDKRDIDERRLTANQRHWREFGYLVVADMIPAELLRKYEALRTSLNLGKANFPTYTPYIEHEIIRQITLSKEMHELLREIMGEDMGLHFILTSYHSTERGWHQDDYLNPGDVYSHYCAAWIALGEISEDAGPFEFIPGSHKWPCVRRELVRKYLAPTYASQSNMEHDGGHWAAYAEVFTNEAYVQEIAARSGEIFQFLGKRGDVFLWHGKLVHRGSAPNDRSLRRPAMISHFSGTKARSDIGTDIRRYGSDGCFYWHF